MQEKEDQAHRSYPATRMYRLSKSPEAKDATPAILTVDPQSLRKVSTSLFLIRPLIPELRPPFSKPGIITSVRKTTPSQDHLTPNPRLPPGFSFITGWPPDALIPNTPPSPSCLLSFSLWPVWLCIWTWTGVGRWVDVLMRTAGLTVLRRTPPNSP